MTLPPLVAMFERILIESGFTKLEHDSEEIEGDEYYLDIQEIQGREVVDGSEERRTVMHEYVFLFARGSAAFAANGKLLSIE